MNIHEFVTERSFLFWDTKKDKLDEAAIVERILNYGDWDDVQELFRIIGIKKVAEIFKTQVARPRNNYRGQIKNYYSMYFERYA